MIDGKKRKVDVQPDKTVMRSLALGGMLGGGGECALDVKNGKVLRIKPFRYDWKYEGASFRPWKIERNGETLEPLMKSLPGTFSLAYKKRTFSPSVSETSAAAFISIANCCSRRLFFASPTI